MNQKEIIGAVVIHRSFGCGIIKECVDNQMKVEFTNMNRVSIFVYPECFIKFLYFSNQDMRDRMQAYLEEWKNESGYAEKEALKKQYEATEKAIIARREAAKEKKRLAAERIMELRANSNLGQFRKWDNSKEENKVLERI